MSVHELYVLTALLAGVGLLWLTLEYLSLLKEYTPGGLYSLELFEQRNLRGLRGWVARRGRWLFDRPGLRMVLLLRLLCTLAVLVSLIGWRSLPTLPLVLLLATTVVVNFRHPYGLDGSDQMTTHVLLVLTLYPFYRSHAWLPEVGLGYLAAQSALSYFTSGFTKAQSPLWRKGKALYLVLNTVAYGNPRGAALLQRWPWLGWVGCWYTIGLEMAFPLAVVLPELGLYVLLGGGVLLHLSIALSMGLNGFFWAFVSTYPALYFAQQWVTSKI